MQRRLFFCLPLLLAGLSQQVQAQTAISIAAARALGPGATVTVRGVVTNGPELGNPLRYLQDATGGLAAYSPSQLVSVDRGDSILITGVLKDYNNLLEMDPVTSVQVLANGVNLPAPVVFNGPITAAFAERYEGRLVQLNNVSSISTTGGSPATTFAGNTNYNLNGNALTQLRVNINSTGPNGLVGQPAPAGAFNVVGIMSQYNSTGPDTTSGYQLLPRFFSDITSNSTTPNVIGIPVAGNISQNGFTVSFQTQNAGNTVINYGLTPALGQTLSSMTQGTSHSMPLTGLAPATVYYVQVASTNSSGTSTSPVVPMITASLSSGRIQVYFNRPVDHSVAIPGNLAVTLPNAIDDTVIAYINRARLSLDVTIYHWDQSGNISNITAALNAARARGVRVRVIMDALTGSTGITNNGHQTLSPSIPVAFRSTTTGIMHNKFMVIDAEATDPNQPLVWAGSTNWHEGQINDDPNSVIIIQDQSLARAYAMEFNEMWGSSVNTPGTLTFGSSKTNNTPHNFKIGGRDVELYFSPSDNVNFHLLETISTASHDFEFASMIITRTDLANALRSKFQQPGFAQCSGGIVNDSTFGSPAVHAGLRATLGNRLQVHTAAPIMHHKYLLVDAGDASSDPTLWVGSHNWTAAADNSNDENTLVIHDAYLVNQYYQEWVQRMKDQNAGLTFCNYSTVLAAPATPAAAQLAVYPNPNRGSFRVELPEGVTGAVSLRVFDATGRAVYSRQLPAAGQAVVDVKAGQLPAGLYLVQLSGSSLHQTVRLVVE